MEMTGNFPKRITRKKKKSWEKPLNNSMGLTVIYLPSKLLAFPNVSQNKLMNLPPSNPQESVHLDSLQPGVASALVAS